MNNLLKIRKIKISNFRSIEDILIKNVSNINVFVGPNEGGKSNILKAMEWFSNEKEMSDNDIPKDKDIKDDEPIVKIVFEIINSDSYLQKIQENVKKDPELTKSLEESIGTLHKVKYLVVEKQKNGKKEFKSFDTLGESTEIISIINLTKYIKDEIGQLNINQTIKDGIKEFLVNKGLEPQPNSNEINIIFNHQDIKNSISIINSHLKPIFDKEIVQIKDTDEITNLKDKLLNHNATNSFSDNVQTQIIRNIEIQWNAKEILKFSIEFYFRTKIEEPIKKMSKKNIPLIDKLEIPIFTLYSTKIGMKGSIKKEGSWEKTIIEKKYPLYYRLFKLADIPSPKLDLKKGSIGTQYLKNKLRKISRFFDKRWTQNKIKFDPYLGESELSIDIQDLDEKREELLNTSPEDRSDGFQWFLGYFITLNYIKKSEMNQILLLDDPAIYLHPDGQKDFLKELEDLSKNIQIFYSTHLVSLFSEDNLDRIYLVKSKNAKTKIEKPWTNEHKDVIEPIRLALGLDIIIFKDNKRILFVEGISDKFILEGILYNKYKKDKFENLYVYPMFGGDDISNENKIIKKIKAMQCINNFYEKKNLRFILDGDKRKKIESNKYIDDEIKKQIIFLGNQNQELEDCIDKKFYLECIKEVYYPLFIEERTKIRMLNKICANTEKNVENKITKSIEKRFKKSNLGGFAKVEIAKYIKMKLISESKNIKFLNNIEKEIKKITKN